MSGTREWRARNPDRARALNQWSHHRMRPEDWAAIWDAQGGRCYLCSEPLIAEKATVEHDHSCCGPMKSCSRCRRGLAHQSCNGAVGLAGDDPERLRRMADALEEAQRGVAQRMASPRSEQLLLL